MSILDVLERVGAVFTGMATWKQVLLGVATTAFLVELTLRNAAPRSKVYAGWKHGMEKVAQFWTAIILSIVYFVSVAGVSLFMKLFGKDPLDRQLASEPSFWRSHEPNPLGPVAAARHQF
jgi:heme/copper-type cytochrome/quinol oxidase subunit 2